MRKFGPWSGRALASTRTLRAATEALATMTSCKTVLATARFSTTGREVAQPLVNRILTTSDLEPKRPSAWRRRACRIGRREPASAFRSACRLEAGCDYARRFGRDLHRELRDPAAPGERVLDVPADHRSL